MPNLALEPFSFFVGFLTASILWFVVSRASPLWQELRANLKEQNVSAQSRRTSSVEENHRRITYRQAQGLHLAAPLFALDEIIQEPLLLSPLPAVEPGAPPRFEDVVTQTIPHLPSWPEIAAVYLPQTLTIPQAMSGNSNIVILGHPGVGKSVALAYLASLAANHDEKLGGHKDHIPFLLHVADLSLPLPEAKDPLKPIIDAVSEHVSMFEISRIPGFIQNSFRGGRALLLLDGYDEIPPADQQTITNYLRILLEHYPRNCIVMTGAPEFIDGLVGIGFAPLALMTWSHFSTQNFMKKWGELWSKTVAMEAWNQAGPGQVDPTLLNIWIGQDIGNLTPLEITLKVWGAYAGDSLGPHVLESIATHVRRIAPSNTPLAALETLAMQVILSSQPVFDPRKAREWVRSFEPIDTSSTDLPIEQGEAQTEIPAQKPDKPGRGRKAEKVLSVPSSGLLGKMTSSGLLVSYPNNKMRFAHSVFAGFLAGRGMTNYAAEEVILNQPDWSGKYLAMRYFAAHGDASNLVQRLLEFSRLPMHRPLFGASRWLRDAPRNAPWRGKLFGTLAAILQTEGIPLGLRGQAMAAFVVSNDPSAATLFRQFGGTTSFELVQLSALGLGAMRDAKAVPVLEGALTAPSLSVRRAACMALVAIGTTQALEIVARTLLHGDEEVRRAAAEALANDTGEGHAMLRDGLTINDLVLRRSVVYGLGRVAEPWAIEALQKMQVEEDQWVVRNAATEVLEARANIGSRAPQKPTAPSEMPWLIEFAAKEGLGISPGAPATDIFLRALKSDDPDARLAVIPYLKHTPSEGIITQLYDAMFKDDPELREYAYYTLWEMGASGVKLPNPSQFGFG